MPYHVICKVASVCAALRADALREHVRVDGRFHTLLLRNVHALFNQVAQIAACNRVHPIGQRLARCFLQVFDRTGMSEYPVTHEFLAELLGVRRATITEAATGLQHADPQRARTHRDPGPRGPRGGRLRVLPRDARPLRGGAPGRLARPPCAGGHVC